MDLSFNLVRDLEYIHRDLDRECKNRDFLSSRLNLEYSCEIEIAFPRRDYYKNVTVLREHIFTKGRKTHTKPRSLLLILN